MPRADYPQSLLDEAIELRRRGASWFDLRRALGLRSENGVRYRLDPEFAARMRFHNSVGGKRRRDERRARRSIVVGSAGAAEHVRPPPEVLAERDATLSLPRTLTSLLCGDPPPGRSALDRRVSCAS